MNAEIRGHISSCAECNIYPTSLQKDTMISHESPDRPWENVGVDHGIARKRLPGHCGILQQFLGSRSSRKHNKINKTLDSTPNKTTQKQIPTTTQRHSSPEQINRDVTTTSRGVRESRE